MPLSLRLRTRRTAVRTAVSHRIAPSLRLSIRNPCRFRHYNDGNDTDLFDLGTLMLIFRAAGRRDQLKLSGIVPCSRVSSDEIALGPVTALQSSSNVRGRLARSGGIWWHTGRPPARCLWFRSFSGGPRSEPDWHLSAHPALQRLSRAVCGWLPPAGCTQDFRHRFGVLHYAYLLASGHPSAAWPPSPCGRLSRPPWRGVTPATTTGPLSPWDSRPVGDPAFVPVIRASAT